MSGFLAIVLVVVAVFGAVVTWAGLLYALLAFAGLAARVDCFRCGGPLERPVTFGALFCARHDPKGALR